ncbi:MAG TPA: metallophosphoesterase [Micromonosporaceae bacterium]|nr:metallophosphoesterase [Micromonosporaceae bacterium]
MPVLGFVGTVALVTTLIHLYIWKRLVRDTTRPGRWRRIGGLVVLALALLIPVAMVGQRTELDWLAWPGYLWIAVMFYLLVVLALLELPMLVTKLVQRYRRKAAPAAEPEPVLAFVGAAGTLTAATEAAESAAPSTAPAPTAPPADSSTEPDSPPAAAPPSPAEPGHDPSRRLLLARSAAIFAGLTAAGITGYGVRTALAPPRLDRVQIPLAKLPRSMDGLRIATVSDIHIGPLAGRAHTERIVAAINRLDADLVAVVGDLVDGTVAELGEAAEPLRDLRAKHGSYFVTGNHEYYTGDADAWVAELDRLGLQVLQNERREIHARGGVLDLAGVNDLAGQGFAEGPDFGAALGGRDPQRPVVLLAHQPIQVHEAARHGVDLQLSGHTHGGQMVPFNLLVGLQQPVVSGHSTIDGTQVYVTNGAGFWGPPVRVGAPPEITLVELRSTA